MKKRPEAGVPAGRRRVCLVTASDVLPPADLPAVAARLAAAGVSLIQMREKEMGGGDLVRLTRAVLEAVRGTDCRVVVNGRLDVALAAGAHGVHLPGDGLPAAQARRLAPPPALLGVSAHTPAEVVAAGQAGADYVFYGPVFATASHPGTVGIGADGLQAALDVAQVPVWAIGGIDPVSVAGLGHLSLAGVACIRALLAPGDPAPVVRALAACSTSPV
jgi:thiamine-phosphate pyrophosphorylase